jgi:uncharacterized membrane protein YfcA
VSELTLYILVVAIFFFAAFLQGLTGFGFGLAAMSLLPLVMPFQDAVILAAVLGLSVNLFTFLSYRHEYDWRLGRGLILGAIVGAPCGVAIVQWVDESILIRALGLLICVFTLNDLVLSKRGKTSIPESWGFPLGLLSGIFGAAFNIGGPPAVMYSYSRPWTKMQVVAVLQVMFLVIGLIRVALSFGAGLVQLQDVKLAVITVLPMFLAIQLGRKLLDKVPQGRLRTVVFVALLLIGANYLLLG